MTAESWSGGCQCGKVRYHLSERPNNPHLCHCRMCQKQFSGYFGVFGSVDRSHFALTRGTLANFASSDLVQRGFCRDCGTPLTFDVHGSTSITVALGSLDRWHEIAPVEQSGIESRVPFFSTLVNLPETTSWQSDGPPAANPQLQRIGASNHQHPDHDTPNAPI